MAGQYVWLSMHVPIRFPATSTAVILIAMALLLAACSSDGDHTPISAQDETVSPTTGNGDVETPRVETPDPAQIANSDGDPGIDSDDSDAEERDDPLEPGEETESPTDQAIKPGLDPDPLPPGNKVSPANAEPAPELRDTLALRFPEHEGFATTPIWNRAGRSLFGAVSTGLIPFPTPHVFAIYEAVPGGFIELAVLDLNPDLFSLLFENSVEQVLLREGDRSSPIIGSAWGDDLWFEVQGAVGAHGSAFALLRFDGLTLQVGLTGDSATPFPGEVIDLDDDGIPEVLLNRTNAYVFCYACAVQEVGFEIARWDGSKLVVVGLEPLPEDPSAELPTEEPDAASRETVDFAIALAEADLWRDAVAAIELAERLEPESEVVRWDAILIRMMAEARLGAAADAANTSYPFLTLVFAGEHAKAAQFLATFGAFELIDLFGPVTAGTVAEGWEDQVAAHVVDYTNRALAVRPDLAPALFLRGLAQFWLSPDQAEQSITDINAASALAPDEPLFEEVANLLTP